MTDIMQLIFGIILLTVGLAAYFLVLQALFEARVAKASVIARSTPARSFGIGLVNFVFFAVIALVLFSLAENAGPFLRGILTVPAIIILALLTLTLSLGLAGMASLVGDRLFPGFAAWKQTLWGAVCLALACALPFAGWFLLLPYVGMVGVGAVILSFFQREK